MNGAIPMDPKQEAEEKRKRAEERITFHYENDIVFSRFWDVFKEQIQKQGGEGNQMQVDLMNAELDKSRERIWAKKWN